MTTSDWITIVGITMQVVVSVTVAAWQIRAAKTAPVLQQNGWHGLVSSRVKWFWRNAWVFVLNLLLMVAFLWREAVSTEPVTRSFVLSAIAVSIWASINFVLVLWYAVYSVVRTERSVATK